MQIIWIANKGHDVTEIGANPNCHSVFSPESNEKEHRRASYGNYEKIIVELVGETTECGWIGPWLSVKRQEIIGRSYTLWLRMNLEETLKSSSLLSMWRWK